jgi:hypothetical protein
MAETKKKVEETPVDEIQFSPVGQKDPNELVPVNLFYDGDKYKDPRYVAVNGKGFLIQRGVEVMVPRYIAEVIKHSDEQDRRTARLIKELNDEYNEKRRLYNL